MISKLSDVADLFEVLPDGVIAIDGRGRIALANAAVCRLLGYGAGELIGEPLGQLIPEQSRASHELHVQRFREQGQPGPMGARPVLSALDKTGREIPVTISIANVDLRGERFSVAVLRDASGVREQLRTALAQAETDPLTGLGNRLNLSQRMRAALAQNQPFGLLFLDLRQFKQFNDQKGHQVGDEVLRLVARRIEALVRARDTAVRYGGDEFVVLIDRTDDPALITARASAIVDSVSRPFRIGEISDAIGVNVGIAMHPLDGSSEETLLAIADRNMYRAKKSEQPYCIDHDPIDRNLMEQKPMRR
jgi:diguanylate cyclase (GGDEF)-like protein/PAS domain S-box-containing protein